MPTIQTLYGSAWQHPGIAWIGALPVVACGWLATARSGGAWRWMFALLQIEIVVDAWATGAFAPWSALGSASGTAATVAGIVFVILGDLRFFYLLERQRSERAAALLWALPVSLLVPVATAVLHQLAPARMSGNLLFCAYEVALFALAAVYYRARLAGRSDYARRLVMFELTQYLCWAVADGLIVFAGAGRLVEVGWALRIFANALYYVGFVPCATFRVPVEARA